MDEDLEENLGLNRGVMLKMIRRNLSVEIPGCEVIGHFEQGMELKAKIGTPHGSAK